MPPKNSRSTKRLRDVGDLLTDLLRRELDPGTLSLRKEKPWASITFTGTRYRFEIGLPDSGPHRRLLRKIAKLADHEFDLPGHFVADFLIHEKQVDDAFITIEILTIADPVSEKKEPAIERN